MISSALMSKTIIISNTDRGGNFSIWAKQTRFFMFSRLQSYRWVSFSPWFDQGKEMHIFLLFVRSFSLYVRWKHAREFDQIRRDSPILFENYNNTESIFHLEEPPVIAEFLRAAYKKRDQLVTVPPDIYRVKHKSKNGMKLLLCKGKNTPGRLKIQNIAKDGLKLKIFRTSVAAPI